jgi:NlpE N-terminal domain
MKLRSLAALALLGATLAGCSHDRTGDAPTATPMPPTVPGVYAGKFPCSNCAAIAATLWLRPDNRFFLRQTFTDDAKSPLGHGDATYALGQWSWNERNAEIVLRGAGPERRLTVLDDDRLTLLASSPVEHVLLRDPAIPAFGDQLRLDGESVVEKTGATFTECLTGLPLRIAEVGAFKELRRQQRIMNPRGKVALTTVDAHLAHVASGEVIVVDRFVTIKPGSACPARDGGQVASTSVPNRG